MRVIQNVSALLVAISAILLFTGCSPKTSPLSEALAKYASVIENLPGDPRAEEAVEALVRAAGQNGTASVDETRESLMYQFKESPLGLYLFDKLCSSQIKADPSSGLKWCATVGEKAAGSALALSSLDRRLAILQGRSPETFLAECQKALDGGVDTPSARVALFRRGRFYRDTGRTKEAGADLVRFWAHYPQTVKSMNCRGMINATLRDAGLRMESLLLEETTEPQSTATYLTEELATGLAMSSATVDGPLPPMVAYVRYAPDIDKIGRAAASGRPGEERPWQDEFCYHMRMAALALDVLDEAKTTEHLTASAQLLSRYLEVSPTDTDGRDLVYLRLHSSCAVGLLERLNGPGTFLRGRNASAQNSIPPDATELLLRMADLDTLLAERIARGQPEGGPAFYYEVVTSYVARARRAADLQRATRAYRHFVDIFSGDSLAATALLRLGELYSEALRVPGQAIGTFDEVITRYPKSSEASAAVVKKCLILYEKENYADAYEQLQAFLSEAQHDNNIALAKYLSACCESGLGSSDAAEEHMAELVQQHPTHSLAPKAMYWIGNRHLATQEYEKAQVAFKDLCERYPGTKEAGEAQRLLDKLGRFVPQGTS